MHIKFIFTPKFIVFFSKSIYTELFMLTYAWSVNDPYAFVDYCHGHILFDLLQTLGTSSEIII